MSWSASIPHTASVTVAIEDTGKFLCNLRDDKPWIWAPRCWALLGGEIGEGEWAQTAAGREILEETGISISTERLIAIAPVLETNGEKQTVSTAFLYKAQRDEFKLMKCFEGRALEWLSIADFVVADFDVRHKNHLTVPAHYEVLKRCAHWH